MAECAVITQNVTLDCDNPIAPGTRDRMVLINFDDWAAAVIGVNGTNAQIVESITFASGGTGYLLEGQNNSNEPKPNYVKGRYSGAFVHELKYKVFANNATVKQELEKLAKGRVVAIVENNYRGAAGESSYEIYGGDSGMIVPDGGITRDPVSTDTNGAWEVSLQSSEFARETHLPKTLFITDYATTKAVFDSLYTA